MLRLGYEACRAGERDAARRWYRLAADNGDAAGDRSSTTEAMYALGGLAGSGRSGRRGKLHPDGTRSSPWAGWTRRRLEATLGP